MSASAIGLGLFWTLSKNEETRLYAFEIKELRNILRVSWSAKKTNEWVLNKVEVNREVRCRQSKEASILWSHHEETREFLEKEIMQDNARKCKRQCQVHAGEEDHARPRWTTSRRG